MNISIIIPTYNRPHDLEKCINSCLVQNYPISDFELIIVNNNIQNLENKQIYTKACLSDKSHNIKYYEEPVPGLLSGRHKGANVSQGDILVFVDEDIIADKNWLASIAESFSNSDVHLVGGRNLPNFKTLPPSWVNYFWNESEEIKICVELSLLDFGKEIKEIDSNYVWGLNFAIRKKTLYELGGFNPDAMPNTLQQFQGDGETGLTLKAKTKGYKALYHPAALVYHQVSKDRLTFEYFDKRYFYQGVCDSYTNIRNENNIVFKKDNSILKIIKKPFRYTKQIIKNTFINNKVEMSQEQMVLMNRLRLQYNVGYNFHQQAVKKNPELLKWVLKEDYWDYHLPEIEYP